VTTQGNMEKARDGIEEQLLGGDALKAANDPEIAGGSRKAGWDPFEIWRTRVRNARLQHPMDGEEAPG